MLGFLKKKISASDLGIIMVRYANEIITADAGRSVGQLLGVLGDGESLAAADRFGMNRSMRKLYVQTYLVLAIDAACSDFDNMIRDNIVDGVISCINSDDTDVDDICRIVSLARSMSNDIDYVDKYVDTKQFSVQFLDRNLIVPCYSIALLDHFRDGFLIKFVNDSEVLSFYCSTFGASVATAYRANVQASKIYKLK
ncbi:hypothetical protein ABLE93_09795 [Xanthobacter sp. KR7-65]|uniref:hypothetical protein n=1 Tax=Xanthobacter sp. KR7-65 TaxID=3156612 RepID=UPI0032B3CCA6